MKIWWWLLFGLPTAAFGPPALANMGSYLVLSATHDLPPPFACVRLIAGPKETISGNQSQWWQLALYKNPDASDPALVIVRGLSKGGLWPSAQTRGSLQRYIIQIPDTAETLEYLNVNTGGALLPGWAQFERLFLPQASGASAWREGMPETCTLLGHVLTLQHTSSNVIWKKWNAKRLELDPGLLVGSSRPFRDQEGHRLSQTPKRQNFTYIPFIEADYETMIAASMNLFTIRPDQEKWVRSKPVFYIRGVGGEPPLKYPADLYRANYLGPVMFMDEPSILMVGDTNVHRTLRHFSDAAALIEKRTRATYESAGSYGSWALEKALKDRGVSLGDMRIKQVDYPSWETLYETVYYQMKGGGMGVVHEGRYQLPEFDRAVQRITGVARRHTGEELLGYHYAFLRGAVKPRDKSWGTAIYGQCDTNLAPLALTVAYDMGARYLWFWTSDHDHHVPWPEQLALSRQLRDHARAHPRPGPDSARASTDVAIVIPNGYFLSLDRLWWVRVLDDKTQNEAWKAYQRLMKRALGAAHDCMDQHLTYDITVDEGHPITGYKRVIRINDAE